MAAPTFNPHFMYGTAWKEERTADLVTQALKVGFRAIDTANQRRHYFEAGVGEAVKNAIDTGFVKRSELFLQSKFTYQRGQDHRLPYDPKDSLTKQVEQSFGSSLEHLQTDYLDSYVLHGPQNGRGLTNDDYEVWRAMESLHGENRTRHLGVSNISFEQLKLLFRFAKVKPTFVQNRCFVDMGWDYEVRQFCLQNQVIYQGFSLLTANHEAVASPLLKQISRNHKATIAQVIFRFSQQVGMLPLTGSTNEDHLKTDLECNQFTLTAEELDNIERVSL